MHYIERITWAKTFPLGDSWGGRASQQSPLPLVSCSCHAPKKPPHDGTEKALPQHPSNREYVGKVEKQLAEIPTDHLLSRWGQPCSPPMGRRRSGKAPGQAHPDTCPAGREGSKHRRNPFGYSRQSEVRPFPPPSQWLWNCQPYVSESEVV